MKPLVMQKNINVIILLMIVRSKFKKIITNFVSSRGLQEHQGYQVCLVEQGPR